MILAYVGVFYLHSIFPFLFLGSTEADDTPIPYSFGQLLFFYLV